MPFEQSPEQEEFRRVVRDFANSEIAPNAFDWDRDHTFPLATIRQMGEHGFVRAALPRGIRR